MIRIQNMIDVSEVDFKKRIKDFFHGGLLSCFSSSLRFSVPVYLRDNEKRSYEKSERANSE